MAKPFIAYDGYNSEVRIISGEGKVAKLEPKNSSVQVSIEDENPKVQRLNQGWVQESDPLLEYLKTAQAENRVIKYRIEIQRRDGVDKQTPIKELMGDQDLAKAYKNTIKIFARADNIVGTEAVTDPAQDTEGGRRSALDAAPSTAQTSSAPSITLEGLAKLKSVVTNPDVLAGLAALTGEGKEQIAEFLKTTNKAQYADVVAGVIEALGDKNLNITNLNTVVEGVLWVADSVQASLFGLTTANRLNTSHKQIRSLVINEINQGNVGAFENKDMNVYKAIGNSTMSKYSVVLNVISHDAPTQYMTLTGESSSQQAQNTPQQAQNAPTRAQNAPAPQQAAPTQSAPVQQKSAPQAQSESQDTGSADGGDEVFDFPAQDHEEVKAAMKPDTPASEENINEILQLASKVEQADYPKLSAYLNSKFGVANFAKIPDEYLSQIISFFNAAGTPDEASRLFNIAVLNHK